MNVRVCAVASPQVVSALGAYLDTLYDAQVSMTCAVWPSMAGSTISLPKGAGMRVSGKEALASLTSSGANVMLLDLLPGDDAEEYVRAALSAGLSLVNAGLQSVATDPLTYRAFRDKGLMVLGDDILEKFSPVVFMKSIMDLIKEGGVTPSSSYVLGAGGHEVDDSMRERRRSDEASLVKGTPSFVGSVEPIDFLGDRRHYYVSVKGKGPLGSDVTVDLAIKYEEIPFRAASMAEVLALLGKGGPDLAEDPHLKGYFKRKVQRGQAL